MYILIRTTIKADENDELYDDADLIGNYDTFHEGIKAAKEYINSLINEADDYYMEQISESCWYFENGEDVDEGTFIEVFDVDDIINHIE